VWQRNVKRTINAIKYSATRKMKVQCVFSLVTETYWHPELTKKLRTEYVVMELEISSNLRHEDKVM